MDGLLIVDKPTGPSSHDVVARVRRVLREPRIGHTGTLDPAASGVLTLVVGRATRLARFLSDATKTYEAVVQLGAATNTYDAAGEVTGPVFEGPWPSRETIDRALDAFRGRFMQRPPAYSAKKIDGHPSYARARRADRQRDYDGVGSSAMQLTPVEVETTAIDIIEYTLPAPPALPGLPAPPALCLRVECSAGFYVRSLAHDLGQALGTGAHLTALRRTRSGDAGIDAAVPLASLEEREHGAALAAEKLVPMSRMLAGLPALTLNDAGIRHTIHGRELAPSDFEDPATMIAATAAGGAPSADAGREAASVVRLLTPAGDLAALGAPRRATGLLHPFVVLV